MGARTGPDFDSHRTEAMLEDADFLFSHGVSLEQAAQRIGVSKEALTKALERRWERQHDGKRHSHTVSEPGERPDGWPVYAMRVAG